MKGKIFYQKEERKMEKEEVKKNSGVVLMDEELDEDGFPKTITLTKEVLEKLPPLAPELVEGILRKGHKMLISGSSKAGKSFLLMQLAIALSKGSKWLEFGCMKSKVLYVNLEIDRASCINRFVEIYKRLGIKPEVDEYLAIWNLRGKSMPLDKLMPILIERTKSESIDVVIIDPIYKVITGDENKATDMAKFTNLFDKLCLETGVAVIYSHHHSKGEQGFKRAMDRASGSGVFARDPDSLLDIIDLILEDEFKQAYLDDQNMTAWRLESSLREFRNITPVNFWFDYPIHIVDKEGLLTKNYASGDPRHNLTKSGKRKQTPESRKLEFDNAFDINLEEDGTCRVSTLAEYLGVTDKTIKNRISEFSDEYINNRGVVSRKSEDGI
jgi:RecA-family ATPase